MSKNISLNEIKEFWPEKAPDVNIVQKYIKKYQNEKIVIKYGGNVLIDRNVFNNFISDVDVLNRLGLSIVVVHGGGPRIKRELDKKKIVSKFINGLRVTNKNIRGIPILKIETPNNGIAIKEAGTNPIKVLKIAVKVRAAIISLILIGAMKRFVKFLLQISSKNIML